MYFFKTLSFRTINFRRKENWIFWTTRLTAGQFENIPVKIEGFKATEMGSNIVGWNFFLLICLFFTPLPQFKLLPLVHTSQWYKCT